MENLLLIKLLCDTIIIVFGVIAICDIIYHRLKQQSTSKKCKTYHMDTKEVRAHFINVEDLQD